MEREKELRRLSELMAENAMWGSNISEKPADVALICSQAWENQQMVELVSDEYDEFMSLAERLHNLVSHNHN